jgi:hypothetical protein
MKSIRNLALAALAAGALLALPAAASASGGFGADAYPASVHASNGQFKLTVGEIWSKTCTAPVLDATLKAPAHSLSASQSKNGPCTYGGTVDMKGCQLILHPDTGSAEIGPPGCGPVTVSSPCMPISIPAQTGIPTTYSGGVDEGTATTGVEVSGEVTLSGFAYYCLGTTSGTLTADWDLATTNEAKESISLYAFTDDVWVGISLSNEKHPRTKAQAFPVNIEGSYSSLDQWALLLEIEGAGFTAECPVVSLNGGELSKEAESVFSLSGTYGGWSAKGKFDPKGQYCISSAGIATVSMNSCRYDLPEVEQTGSSYTVKGAAIACSNGGDAITLKIRYDTCTIRLPAQSLQASLVNIGYGVGAMVETDLGGSNLKYTTEGIGCAGALLEESGEDGVMGQEFFLHGTLPG